jgi:hypothetical protein
MKKLNHILILIAAILIAGCAAFFSITGLGLLFRSISVMVMAGSLEYGKIVTAAYLKKNWDMLSKAIRYYLSIAVVILMIITSMGIFGFLSDAFQTQSLRLEMVDRQVDLINNKINTNKSEIARYNDNIKNYSALRNSQEANFSKLVERNGQTGRVNSMIKNADNQIAQVSKKIDSLQNVNILLYQNIDSVKNTNIDMEREIGGFRFIAESFNVPLKKAVKWFILMIVFVFDPLAIALVIALNSISTSEPLFEPVTEEEPSDTEKKKQGRPKKILDYK